MSSRTTRFTRATYFTRREVTTENCGSGEEAAGAKVDQYFSLNNCVHTHEQDRTRQAYSVGGTTFVQLEFIMKCIVGLTYACVISGIEFFWNDLALGS